VLRLVAASAALVAVACATAAGAVAPIDFLEPLPATPSTARLAVETGSGAAQRLAIWTARNRTGELCVGWRSGESREPPAAFTCLRAGLEPPLVAGVDGGGRGGQTTWSAIPGVASPLVDHLSAQTLWGTRTVSDVPLRATVGFAGWHAFSTGSLAPPSSTTLTGYAADGSEVAEQSGSAIHPPLSAVRTTPPPGIPPGINAIVVTPPPVNGRASPATGPAWHATATNLPRAGSVAKRAIPLALADKAVRAILSSHEGWLTGMTGWGDCGGRPLGAVVSFRFARPATFTATLPAVGKASGTFAYSTLVRRIQATDWGVMSVWVDTNTAAVVGVDEFGLPLPYENGSQTTTLATAEPAHDAGGTNSGRCAEPSGD
jgi:hypothetical protein